MEEARTAAIEVRGLRKVFGQSPALDGIDLSVSRGEVFGYIGPNGAGKSTTIRILTGIQTEFEGEARVDGVSVRENALEVKRRIGYVPENAALYDALEVREFLVLVGRLHDLADELTLARAEEILAAFDLLPRIDSRIASLSKGMRQKVLVASALLHDPAVVFLDEPLSGLDVAATVLMKELIRGLADEGRAVFYSSHVMDVVERICDRIAIIDRGKIVAQGSFEELQAASSGGTLERIFVELTRGHGAEEKAQRILGALKRQGPA